MIVAVGVAVFITVIGARRCKTLEPITAERRAHLRWSVIEGCRINRCSPDKLQNLLNQVDAYPGVVEDEGR